jgi:DNA polymerase/3'-5' exonuclease PolX
VGDDRRADDTADGVRAMRIDIKAWHYSQRGPAMLAYTGNQLFNRGIRLYADASGLHLNDKTLCSSSSQAGVSAARPEDIWTCHPRECNTEAAVFQHLGLEFREPHERLIAYVDGLEDCLHRLLQRRFVDHGQH